MTLSWVLTGALVWVLTTIIDVCFWPLCWFERWQAKRKTKDDGYGDMR